MEKEEDEERVLVLRNEPGGSMRGLRPLIHLKKKEVEVRDLLGRRPRRPLWPEKSHILRI